MNATNLATRLSSNLRTLHRELLQATERGHARIFGAVRSPYERLALVEKDPLFAWLKPLTAGLAELDDAIDRVEEPERLDAAVKAVARLLQGGDQAFRESYATYLQASPEVVMAHAAVRGELRSLGLAAAA